MNMSRIINHIKLQLGLNMITLPFVDEMTGRPKPSEQIIMEVLTTMTIPVFSDYCPWYRKEIVPIRQLRQVDRRRGIYLLPSILINPPIKWLSDASLNHDAASANVDAVAMGFGVGFASEMVVTTNAFNMVVGQMRNEPTFEYLGANKIKLNNYPPTFLDIIVASEHLPNGESIEDGYYNSFLSLATLDVKVFLYNHLKFFDGNANPHGEIKLHSADFQSADAERTTLLTEWKAVHHLDKPSAFNYF